MRHIEMGNGSSLKSPFVIGQIVGFVEPPRHRKNLCVVGGYWFVVSTEPRHEELARGEIAAAGLVVYWPTEEVQERHGRGATRLVRRGVFPSYVFVKCEAHADHWRLITAARGVHRLLGHGESPTPIHEGEIEGIRLYEAQKAAEEEERQRLEEAAERARQGGKSGMVWHFEPEEVVRIKSGPFAGFVAQLEMAVDDNDRIRALVSLFGRQSVTEFSAFDIEKL